MGIVMLCLGYGYRVGITKDEKKKGCLTVYSRLIHQQQNNIIEKSGASYFKEHEYDGW